MYLKTFVYFIRPAQRLCGGTGHIPTPEGAFVVEFCLITSDNYLAVPCKGQHKHMYGCLV